MVKEILSFSTLLEMNNFHPVGLLRTFLFASVLLCFMCLSLLSSPTGSRIDVSVNGAYHKRSEENERLDEVTREVQRSVRTNSCREIIACNIVEPDIEEYMSQLPQVDGKLPKRAVTNHGAAILHQGCLFQLLRKCTVTPNKQKPEYILFSVADDSVCSRMIESINLRPPHSMPFRALASFPRSGNTWTRSLLQVATNIYTTSVYWEGESKLRRAQTIFRGNLVDYKDGQGVCTKTHEHDRGTTKFFREGAILLIRNPINSAVSDFLRCGRDHNRSEEETIQLLETNHVIWRGFLRKRFPEWTAMAVDWINTVKRLLIVYYEDLKENTAREILRMVTFLQQPVDLPRIQCAVHRFPSVTKNQTFFIPQVDTILQHYVHIVNETLIARNVRPLPTYNRLFT
ncbi:WSC domain-containing protein 1 [Holothuria leucospilota]|uniref:WSC domain-containing protein 1 n=1 Tax=Holothuria leucospilota TaxID=206669 RepID=A0A9Q0YLB5_HOLLE|nr:WSC domain-containing protein 1 [Holothuria leucospilota]